jgi:HEAT repeat protein
VTRHLLLFACITPLVFVQIPLASAQTPKDVRNAAKDGNVSKVAGYLDARSLDTRIEAVKQLISLGGQESIAPLIKATHDADPEVQIRASDGLVNFYLPGYVRQGIGSSLVRAGATIKAKFGDTNDQVIDAFVTVRPEVIDALGQLARSGASLDSRANACRALGILRGDAALDSLVDALQSKDNNVMFESLIAIQKIRDPKAGPRIVFLLRDLDERVQTAAIETSGLLRTTEALPTLRDIVSSPRNSKVERSALFAISNMPEARDRDLFKRYIASKDDKLRAAAAEGLGRIKDPGDEPTLEKLWQTEEKMAPRLAACFGLVLEGKLELGEDAPFRYLINSLNSAVWNQTAYAYLVEAARDSRVLAALYGPIEQTDSPRDERIWLAKVLAASGDNGTVPVLDKTSQDTDKDVAAAGLRALRSLKARLGE